MEPRILLARAAEYVKSLHDRDATGHDWHHIERVRAWSARLADMTGVDRFVCELAALLHDAADEKLVPAKDEALARIARWLADNGATEDVIGRVMPIVGGIGFRGGNGEPPATLEGRVVQDADRLDALGAIGIARTFMYAGAKGHAMHDPKARPRSAMTEAEYRGSPGTAVQHFHEKLLKLAGLMHTEAARRLAEERHAFMVSFLRQFEREWDAAGGPS